MKNISSKIGLSALLSSVVVGVLVLAGCQDNTLPTSGSKVDLTPPEAAFSITIGDDPYTVDFGNLSSSATQFEWNFGDESTSTDFEPAHTYDAEGSYTVVLTAWDNLGVEDTVSLEVEIIVPSCATPVINNPGFEDHPNRDDNRTEWRNTALESSADDLFGNGSWVLQTSSSESNNTTTGGANSGKLPAGSDMLTSRRWIYQAITVETNKDYIVSWSQKSSGATTINADIYNGTFDDAAVIDDESYIMHSESFVHAGDGEHSRVQFTFNSEDRTEVVLFITNEYDATGAADTWFDDFEIEVICL